MNSPIATLIEVLQNVISSAENYKSQLQGNEAATRAALIDPVLQCLGWDISNPARVIVEKTQTIGGKQFRVDYALLADGEVNLVVEAKKLGGQLDDDFLQVVQYAFGLGTDSVFISDGLRWRHYKGKDFSPKNKDFTEKNLLTDNLSEIAAYLIEHLDAALVAPESTEIDKLDEKIENLESKVASLEAIISEQKLQNMERRIASLEKISGQKVDVEKLSPQGPKIPEGFEIISRNKDYKGTRPTGLFLPNSEQKTISGWTPVLVGICRYVLENVPTLREQMPFPDNAGRSINLISLQRPPSNVSSAAVEVGGQTFYLYTNYSANSIAANVLHLHRQIPMTQNQLPVAIRLKKSNKQEGDG